jgi:hypothetical protein
MISKPILKGYKKVTEKLTQGVPSQQGDSAMVTSARAVPQGS